MKGLAAIYILPKQSLVPPAHQTTTGRQMIRHSKGQGKGVQSCRVLPYLHMHAARCLLSGVQPSWASSLLCRAEAGQKRPVLPATSCVLESHSEHEGHPEQCPALPRHTCTCTRPEGQSVQCPAYAHVQTLTH